MGSTNPTHPKSRNHGQAPSTSSHKFHSSLAQERARRHQMAPMNVYVTSAMGPSSPKAPRNVTDKFRFGLNARTDENPAKQADDAADATTQGQSSHMQPQRDGLFLANGLWTTYDDLLNSAAADLGYNLHYADEVWTQGRREAKTSQVDASLHSAFTLARAVATGSPNYQEHDISFPTLEGRLDLAAGFQSLGGYYNRSTAPRQREAGVSQRQYPTSPLAPQLQHTYNLHPRAIPAMPRAQRQEDFRPSMSFSQATKGNVIVRQRAQLHSFHEQPHQQHNLSNTTASTHQSHLYATRMPVEMRRVPVVAHGPQANIPTYLADKGMFSPNRVQPNHASHHQQPGLDPGGRLHVPNSRGTKRAASAGDESALPERPSKRGAAGYDYIGINTARGYLPEDGYYGSGQGFIK